MKKRFKVNLKLVKTYTDETGVSTNLINKIILTKTLDPEDECHEDVITYVEWETQPTIAEVIEFIKVLEKFELFYEACSDNLIMVKGALDKHDNTIEFYGTEYKDIPSNFDEEKIVKI